MEEHDHAAFTAWMDEQLRKERKEAKLKRQPKSKTNKK